MTPESIRPLYAYHYWAFEQVWECILLHVTNHATDHRTQVLTLLHIHFQVKTVEQDMIIYLSQSNPE